MLSPEAHWAWLTCGVYQRIPKLHESVLLPYIEIQDNCDRVNSQPQSLSRQEMTQKRAGAEVGMAWA